VRLESINQDVLTFELQTSEQGLVIPPLWWGTMEFSDHAVLLGFALADFNEQDYIRNKADFR